MNKFGKVIGIFLFIGIICTSCLLFVSKPKGEVISTEYPQDAVEKVFPSEKVGIQKYHMEVFESVRVELDSLNNYYQTIEKLPCMPQEVFNEYWIGLKNHYNDILYIKCDTLFRLQQLSWQKVS